MRTRQAIFMSKVRDNSTPEMILGACWGVPAQLLAIRCQACHYEGFCETNVLENKFLQSLVKEFNI